LAESGPSQSHDVVSVTKLASLPQNLTLFALLSNLPSFCALTPSGNAGHRRSKENPPFLYSSNPCSSPDTFSQPRALRALRKPSDGPRFRHLETTGCDTGGHVRDCAMRPSAFPPPEPRRLALLLVRLLGFFPGLSRHPASLGAVHWGARPVLVEVRSAEVKRYWKFVIFCPEVLRILGRCL
jgi:hypothetical protein